ncbi:energy-coupling factor ABC transporter ATP-binding protein [Anaerocolumna sp. AGMB13025]|uniref:energy-coupling factor ABC transporter ATP-binding protein n=1 Tax=Anaerocolumna sp. AGMB13025 TaxID=3039116 RepID=UPI00241D6E80|nr:energy-coupling factor ABC transporter ATP-binding protein [Anaerocolumna sp. AGMB13025]WFR58090.1 energy-coupling factor ABC transporter ATP-binding protein [Anaerocolumna sp. AGMB13025]
MNQFLINCKELCFSYENGIEILKGISLQTRPKEALGIIGANGVGKSTLLRILVGLELNFSGEVFVKGIPVNKKSLPEIRSKIGYLFQDSDNQLFTQTVYNDVAFGPRNYGLKEEEVKERVESALTTIGITHLKDKQIYKMSGGEKKMASIATVLAMNPEIILLDEPTIALDPKNRRNLIQTLNRLEYAKIVASHDLDMILETCDRVILMSEGKIIREGATELILRDKELLEAFGLELPLCLRGYQGRTRNSYR